MSWGRVYPNAEKPRRNKADTPVTSDEVAMLKSVMSSILATIPMPDDGARLILATIPMPDDGARPIGNGLAAANFRCCVRFSGFRRPVFFAGAADGTGRGRTGSGPVPRAAPRPDSPPPVL